MQNTRPKKSLYDAYRFPGFTPVRVLKGVFGEPGARVLQLKRRSKKQSAGHVAQSTTAGTTRKPDRRGISPAVTSGFILSLMSGGLSAGSAKL